MKNRLIILIATSLPLLLLDQGTKLYVASRFALHESVTVLQNFFHFTYVRNKGAAFGIFADSSLRIPFFITVSVLALGGIVWYLMRTHHANRMFVLSLSLVFAGALGNLIDRIRFGEVIDFIDVHWYQYHWPAFNIADSAITVGVALLLIDTWREERAKKQKN